METMMSDKTHDLSLPASTPITGEGLKPVLKQSKADFDLHVLLIMKQLACSKSAALVVAYTEGPALLDKRLAL